MKRRFYLRRVYKILTVSILSLTLACSAGAQYDSVFASHIRITRDNWGVPHIYGPTDEHCSFGIMYTQCEDNFWQVEETMIRQLGRAAELYGEGELGNDAQVARFECVRKAKEAYAAADPYIKKMCDAAAAGINYYIHTNADAQPRLIKFYEPWFFLVTAPNSPGDHGITGAEMRAAGAGRTTEPGTSEAGEDEWITAEASGSNALALAPSRTKNGRAILVINPHVGFFGVGQRYEAHLVSKQGMNVSGFAILGTFYIWSGFTSNTAWTHTNTGSDYKDVYLEVLNPSDSNQYKYDDQLRPVITWKDSIAYKTSTGTAYRSFIFRKTQHGPVVGKRDSMLVTVRSVLDDNPAEYIAQSLAMAKAKTLEEFQAAMANCQLATNTMYADRKGNIAYWHGNRIPRRDSLLNWRLPVMGNTSATAWQGFHTAEETIHFLNPSLGFLQNCNSTPFRAGAAATESGWGKFPKYMAYDEQNLRSQEMILQVSQKNKLSTDDVAAAVTSKNIPEMRKWLGQIITDYKKIIVTKPGIATELHEVIDTLERWNMRYDTMSTATTISFGWHTQYMSWIGKNIRGKVPSSEMTKYLNEQKLLLPEGMPTELLLAAVRDLNKEYGTPFVKWGDVCRLQRVQSAGTERFNDSKYSIAVNAAPSSMGSLFAFNLRFDPGMKKGYGTSGNSYAAIVNFGSKINARSIVTFGQSSDPSSPHFFDQAYLYAKADYKKAWYYKKDVKKHATQSYQPGKKR